MKKFFFLSIITFLVTSLCFASVRRIGYWGTPVTGLDYSTPALAVTASGVGDTIYVYGGNGSSNWIFDLTKRLVIIGTGYFYAPSTPNNTISNLNLQNYNAYSAAQVQLSDGSTGSVVIGITGYVYVNQSHTAAINNIRVSNCYTNFAGNFPPTMFKNGMAYDGWEISKCYFNGYAFGYPSSNTAKLTSFKFLNDILLNSSIVFSNLPGQNGIIENCTFYSYNPYQNNQFNGANLLIQNCIFTNSANPSGYNNSVFNNCYLDYTPSPSLVGANNQINQGNTNVYVGIPTQGTYGDDGRWALKAGSTAIGAGINGIDLGAFGGVNPYKLSGIPAVPAFYKLTAPGTAANSNPYTLTFSVRANN